MRGGGRRRRNGGERERPIPLEPVDLLAGLAPGLELQADEVPAALDPDGDAAAATTSVAEVGKLVRAGEGVVRRLIRTSVLKPTDGAPGAEPADVDRAGVLPRTPDKPGE